MAAPAAYPHLTGAGLGRKVGSKNKIPKAAKDLIAEVAEQLGGAKRLLAWCKKNPKNEDCFWTSIYPKMLPLKLEGQDGPLEVILRDLRRE